MQQPQPREAFQNPDAYSSTTLRALRVVFCRAYDSETLALSGESEQDADHPGASTCRDANSVDERL